jgi:ATP-dependent DNA helicase RecG
MIKKSYFSKTLETEITYLKGVGPNRGNKLKKYGIEVLSDLLYHFPRRYIDRSNILLINKLKIGEQGLIVGKIISANIKQTKKRRFFELEINDQTGSIKCIWFRGLSWISEKFEIGESIAIYGKIEFYNGFRMIHPEFDLLDENEDPINTGKIISIYPSNSDLKSVGMDSRGFRRIINHAIENIEFSITDFFDRATLELEQLITLKKALIDIHQPKNMDTLDQSIRRLKFNEHFFMQLLMAIKKSNHKKNRTKQFISKDDYVSKIYKLLPFNLTNSQIRVLKEIRGDLESSNSMNRLIQGDVGSGKTIVAILASAIAIDNTSQVAIMAPTEILAEQHFNSFKSYCDRINLSCELLISDIKKNMKEKIIADLKSGNINIIVGTHALIQENIEFKNLGLSIIDEQHRFGVEHRKNLIKKAENSNVLAMTATPIPRTLSMTLHGDLDISIIDEIPKNRIPIKTKVVNENHLDSIYQFIMKELKNKRQCYIVYPIIEESESLDLEAANTAYKNIKENIFKDFKVGYLNGKMNKVERDKQMSLFISGNIDVLVATTVVEVGIDNPNATIMLIENAERFGLTQLHQLRGRIGRGEHQGYCMLVQRKRSLLSDHRLKVMENTANGFKISDEDLKLRGPGEFFGKKQHGYMKTKIVDIPRDFEIIGQARKLAFNIISKDDELKLPENQNIKHELFDKYSNMLEFINIG